MIGSYDATPGAAELSLASKNLAHHVHWHQIARTDGFTFWGACGAIRTSAFHAVSGFDERYTVPSIEDIELGYPAATRRHADSRRPDARGHAHLKRWTAASLIEPISPRGLPWSELILREGRIDDDLNLQTRARLGVAGTWLLVLRAVARVLDPGSGVGGGRADGGPVPARSAAVALASRGCAALPSRRRQSLAVAAVCLQWRGVRPRCCASSAEGSARTANGAKPRERRCRSRSSGPGPRVSRAALTLARAGRRTIVFEAGERVGGIARTETYKGYRFDIGGHRFFTKVPEVQALWEEWLDSEFKLVSRLSRIFYDGHFYDYPLRLPNVVSNLGGLEARGSRSATRRRGSRRFGRKKLPGLGHRTASGIGSTGPSSRRIRRRSGVSPARDSRRLGGAARPRPLARARRPPCDLRRQRHRARSSRPSHYPRLGPGQMWERCTELVQQAGGQVELNARVDGHPSRERPGDLRRASAATGRPRRVPVSAVIASMPMPSLVRALTPSRCRRRRDAAEDSGSAIS